MTLMILILTGAVKCFSLRDLEESFILGFLGISHHSWLTATQQYPLGKNPTVAKSNCARHACPGAAGHHWRKSLSYSGRTYFLLQVVRKFLFLTVQQFYTFSPLHVSSIPLPPSSSI
jgi:hypothetical protein